MIAAILRIDITKTEKLDYTAEYEYDRTFIYFMDDNRVLPTNFVRDVKHFIANELFIYSRGFGGNVQPFKLSDRYQQVVDWNKASQTNLERFMEAFLSDVVELYNDDSSNDDMISITSSVQEIRANIGGYELV